MQQILPIEGISKGKRVTMGLRSMGGMRRRTGTDFNDFELYGSTVTHPKYKNEASKALVETMISHANNTPTQIHHIAGANPSLDRLYRKIGSQYNIPPNLHLPE